MKRLSETVALITGASSGIGEATAIALARQGACVALAARRRERLDSLRSRIIADGGQALVVETDITDQAQAIQAVQQTVKTFGRIDTLVNNAGVMLLGPVDGAPTEEWEIMVSVNIMGLLYVAHAALPYLLEAAMSSPRKVADLVNISSIAGRKGFPGAGVYNLTKFGAVGFSEALRQEVTKRYVRVSCVEPGVVQTELVSHNRPEIVENRAKSFVDVEPLEAEDVAELIEFIVTRPRRVSVDEVLVRPTNAP